MNKRPPGRNIGGKHTRQRMDEAVELLQTLDEVRDQERQHLSRELHDMLVASLSATKLDCDWLLRTQVTSQTESQKRLSRVSASLGEAIQFARRVIDQLWPTAVQHLGFVPAIQAQLSELSTGLGIDVQSHVEGDLKTLPEPQAMLLYRAVQGVLSGLVQTAPPPRVALTVRRAGNGVELEFTLGGAKADRDARLVQLERALMRERALRLGGEYLLADDGQGTVQLHLFLPLASPAGRSSTALRTPGR